MGGISGKAANRRRIQFSTLEEYAGLAVLCGTQAKNGLFFGCVDYDVKGLEKEIIEKGKRILEKLPVTRIEKTPSGGLHYYYWSKKQPTTVAQYRNLVALELLGARKLVITAPSEGYSVISDRDIAVVDDLESLFKQLVSQNASEEEVNSNIWFEENQIRRKRYRGPNPPCISSLLKGVKEGIRNETGIRIASYCRNYRKLAKKSTKKILEDWNSKNQPPMPKKRIVLNLEVSRRKPICVQL